MSVGDAFESLLMKSFINGLRPNPCDITPRSDINLLSADLTPSLPLISSSLIGRDESGLGYVAREETKIEGEIIRIIISGVTDSLRPNSGQPIPIYGHNSCIGFHDERGSEHRVWECHGHVTTYDENNCRSLEYSFRNYIERL